MIKLTPEHVGTRVLLSNGKIGLVTGFHGTSDLHVSCNRFNPPKRVAVSVEGWTAFFDLEGFHMEHGDDPHFYRIILFLDAPNPLDVEVPEWCRWVVGWRVFSDAPPHLIPAIHGAADFPHDVFGWSPAPGQLLPKNNEEFN